MLKNTKAVGIAAAIALLTGVAFAPSATAVGTDKPEQSLDNGSSYDSGERIDYYIEYVRTKCTVTTTVGNKSRTAVARQDDSSDVLTFGEVNSFIGAPSIAGEYTVASQVSKSCKDDAGYKWAENMADDITVGDDVEMNYAFEDVVNTTAGGLTGTMENAATPEDLGKTKISVYRLGVLVGSGTTNNAGEFSIQIAKKHFRANGDTRFTVKISANTLWYIEDGVQAIFANIANIT
jgi:hypothetical protein